jgi:hypothetical protein
MTTVHTTAQVNQDKLAKHRRTLPAQGIDRILRTGEVQRRFVRYSTKGRGQIEPKMPEPLALEAAIQDVCGDPGTAGGRHFAYICTPSNIRKLKKYASGVSAGVPQLELGDEADVRGMLRATKDKPQIAAMLAAEYQGRNESGVPRADVLELIMKRLNSVDKAEKAKAGRGSASDAEMAAALEE